MLINFNYNFNLMQDSEIILEFNNHFSDTFHANLTTVLASYLNFDECMLLSKVNKQLGK